MIFVGHPIIEKILEKDNSEYLTDYRNAVSDNYFHHKNRFIHLTYYYFKF